MLCRPHALISHSQPRCELYRMCPFKLMLLLQNEEASDNKGCYSELNKKLEAKLVTPVEAAALSMKKDSVVWSKGLFATPRVSSSTPFKNDV